MKVSRVLVIDDDAGTLVAYKYLLRLAGHEVATAALGEDGLTAARRDQFDVVLCDQRLPDRSGIEVVREIRDTCPGTSIVLVTGWGTPELVLEAKRNGATSYAEKPLIGDELLAVVDEALRLQANGEAVTPARPVGYAARRWADVIARAAYADHDLKTLGEWCRSVGLAQSTLKAWCKAAGATARVSTTLVRLLPIVMRHSGEAWSLQRQLDIIDARTAAALLRRAGFAGGSTVPDLESFLRCQQLITSPELVVALRERLTHVKHR